MPTNPYGHMQLIRLSPTTGEALNRLNILQGQILHGRVYRMEPFAAGAGTSSQSTGTGGIAKIALGAQLIEAVVSELIPEGSNVTLEVVNLSDDSFTLRLLSVVAPKSGEANASLIASEPDLLELSPETREAIAKSVTMPPGESESAAPAKLVQIPNWTELPKIVAETLRAAISEGFIDPAHFTARPPQICSALQQSINEFQATLTQLTESTSGVTGVTKELMESIASIIRIIRPMIAAIPATEISVGESVSQIAAALKEISFILRPAMEPGAVISLSGEDGIHNVKIPIQHVQAQSDVASAQSTARSEVTPPSTSTTQTQSAPGPEAGQQAPGSGTAPTNAPVSESAQPATGQLPIASPTTPSGSQIDGVALPTQSTSQSTHSIPKPTTDAPQTGREASISPELEAQSAQIRHARNLLLGIRTLSLLADRMARTSGWTIKQSAILGHHASRLGALADALEGAIIAPLVTQSTDIPDAIPRLLLHLLFPGGHAEFGVIQPDDAGRDSHREEKHEDNEAGDKNNCVGIIRLQTDDLGSLSVRLDYREIDEEGRDIPDIWVSGIFRADATVADEIRAGFPTLERALSARGISTEGFRVTGINDGSVGKTNITSKNKKNNDGGDLDIKI